MSNKNKPPIFIIGNPRSGTTLLRLMLTCHPGIAVAPESGFLIGLYAKYKEFCGDMQQIKEFAKDVVNSQKVELWRITVHGLTEYLIDKNSKTYSELSSGVYEYYGLIHQSKKDRWGDKNNSFLNYIDLISVIFPEAVFIHIIRDGRDIACSYRDMSQIIPEKYSPSVPNSVLGAALHWRNNLLKIRYNFQQIGWNRVYEIRYEDLVNNPVLTLTEICNFLDEEFSAEMLTFDEQNREKELEPTAFDAWKSRTKEKLSSSRIERWRTEMSTKDVLLFECATRDILTKYRYPLMHAKVNYRIRVFCALIKSVLSIRKMLDVIFKSTRKITSKVLNVIFVNKCYKLFRNKGVF